MPKHLISITNAAEQDLAEIVDYIANDNPAAALKLAENRVRSGRIGAPCLIIPSSRNTGVSGLSSAG